jgi:hypothetical protein
MENSLAPVMKSLTLLLAAEAAAVLAAHAAAACHELALSRTLNTSSSAEALELSLFLMEISLSPMSSNMVSCLLAQRKNAEPVAKCGQQ